MTNGPTWSKGVQTPRLNQPYQIHLGPSNTSAPLKHLVWFFSTGRKCQGVHRGCEQIGWEMGDRSTIGAGVKSCFQGGERERGNFRLKREYEGMNLSVSLRRPSRDLRPKTPPCFEGSCGDERRGVRFRAKGGFSRNLDCSNRLGKPPSGALKTNLDWQRDIILAQCKHTLLHPTSLLSPLSHRVAISTTRPEVSLAPNEKAYGKLRARFDRVRKPGPKK